VGAREKSGSENDIFVDRGLRAAALPTILMKWLS
jgi:hypothetical protein